MSAIAIVGSGAAFDIAPENVIALNPPNLAKSYGLFLFGGDATESVQNLVDSGAPLVVLGAPVYNAGSVTLSPTAGFEGDVAHTSPCTLMVVTNVGTGNGRYIGYSPDGGAGISLQRSNTTLAAIITGNSRLLTTAGTWAGTANQFIALSYDGATVTIYIGLNGVLTKTTGAYVGSPVANKLRVGALGGSGTSFNVAAAQNAQLLNDAEVQASYDFYRFTLPKQRGVVVA